MQAQSITGITNVAGNIPKNPSPQFKVALSYINYVFSGQFETLSTILSDDFQYTTLPQTLGQDRPALGKEEALATMEFFLSVVKKENFVATIHETLEGPNGVVLHITSKGTCVSGSPYANDYIFWINVKQVGGGLKVAAVKEVMDSKYTIDFVEMEHPALFAIEADRVMKAMGAKL
ncbi:hypothetical protein C8Q75DRAFT_743129 [Abortiporus biennis]|nr:hypothetical protein C8Q75DRAFT_743129 [Abortiporus biennis]